MTHRLRLSILVVVCFGGRVAVASAQAPTETVEYYATDAIGSIRVVFDANGNVTGRMDFAPFGAELFTGQNVPSNRFAGLFRDGEAGLDYAQARSYHVRTARFTRPDPVYAGLSEPQQWNRYAYAVSSPLSFTDQTGLQAQEVFSVTPECRPGRYSSCPSTITVILPALPAGPMDVERFFDPNLVGYQGGENARAEAQYALNVAVTWAQGVVASFAEKNGGNAPTASVTTTTEVKLPDGTKISPKDGGLLGLSRDVDRRAGALTEPKIYAEFYVVSALGSLVVNSAARSAVGELLFARGGGLLNSNDYLRIGRGWYGSARDGSEWFRIAIGSRRGSVHWHIRLWKY